MRRSKTTTIVAALVSASVVVPPLLGRGTGTCRSAGAPFFVCHAAAAATTSSVDAAKDEVLETLKFDHEPVGAIPNAPKSSSSSRSQRWEVEVNQRLVWTVRTNVTLLQRLNRPSSPPSPPLLSWDSSHEAEEQRSFDAGFRWWLIVKSEEAALNYESTSFPASRIDVEHPLTLRWGKPSAFDGSGTLSVVGTSTKTLILPWKREDDASFTTHDAVHDRHRAAVRRPAWVHVELWVQPMGRDHLATGATGDLDRPGHRRASRSLVRRHVASTHELVQEISLVATYQSESLVVPSPSSTTTEATPFSISQDAGNSLKTEGLRGADSSSTEGSDDNYDQTTSTRGSRSVVAPSRLLRGMAFLVRSVRWLLTALGGLVALLFAAIFLENHLLPRDEVGGVADDASHHNDEKISNDPDEAFDDDEMRELHGCDHGEGDHNEGDHGNYNHEEEPDYNDENGDFEEEAGDVDERSDEEEGDDVDEDQGLLVEVADVPLAVRIQNVDGSSQTVTTKFRDVDNACAAVETTEIQDTKCGDVTKHQERGIDSEDSKNIRVPCGEEATARQNFDKRCSAPAHGLESGRSFGRNDEAVHENHGTNGTGDLCTEEAVPMAANLCSVLPFRSESVHALDHHEPSDLTQDGSESNPAMTTVQNRGRITANDSTNTSLASSNDLRPPVMQRQASSGRKPIVGRPKSSMLTFLQEMEQWSDEQEKERRPPSTVVVVAPPASKATAQFSSIPMFFEPGIVPLSSRRRMSKTLVSSSSDHELAQLSSQSAQQESRMLLTLHSNHIHQQPPRCIKAPPMTFDSASSPAALVPAKSSLPSTPRSTEGHLDGVVDERKVPGSTSGLAVSNAAFAIDHNIGSSSSRHPGARIDDRVGELLPDNVMSTLESTSLQHGDSERHQFDCPSPEDTCFPQGQDSPAPSTCSKQSPETSLKRKREGALEGGDSAPAKRSSPSSRFLASKSVDENALSCAPSTALETCATDKGVHELSVASTSCIAILRESMADGTEQGNQTSLEKCDASRLVNTTASKLGNVDSPIGCSFPSTSDAVKDGIQPSPREIVFPPLEVTLFFDSPVKDPTVCAATDSAADDALGPVGARNDSVASAGHGSGQSSDNLNFAVLDGLHESSAPSDTASPVLTLKDHQEFDGASSHADCEPKLRSACNRATKQETLSETELSTESSEVDAAGLGSDAYVEEPTGQFALGPLDLSAGTLSPDSQASADRPDLGRPRTDDDICEDDEYSSANLERLQIGNISACTSSAPCSRVYLEPPTPLGIEEDLKASSTASRSTSQDDDEDSVQFVKTIAQVLPDVPISSSLMSAATRTSDETMFMRKVRSRLQSGRATTPKERVAKLSSGKRLSKELSGKTAGKRKQKGLQSSRERKSGGQVLLPRLSRVQDIVRRSADRKPPPASLKAAPNGSDERREMLFPPSPEPIQSGGPLTSTWNGTARATSESASHGTVPNDKVGKRGIRVFGSKAPPTTLSRSFGPDQWTTERNGSP